MPARYLVALRISAEQQQAEGLSLGADAYLTKPFSAEVLLAHITSLLANRRKLRELFAAKESNEKHDQQEEILGTPDKMFMDTLRDAINKHMSNTRLKMDDLGADMGISRVQLYRKVKALTGMSPVELLKEMRLQRAMKHKYNRNSTLCNAFWITITRDS